MADFGHVKMSRQAYATDRFWLEKREFSKWEAWEWMIQAAAWKDHRRVVGMTPIEIHRGEFLGSIRFLAEAWGWKKSRVHEFLRLLIEERQISGQRETHAGTVYLLDKYERYQSTPRKKRTENRTQSGQRADSERTNKKKVKKGNLTTLSDFALFDEAWAAYPKRPNNSKAAARRAWDARVKAGADPAAMIDGVQRYAAYIAAKHTDPEHVKMAATFFGPDEHWKSNFTTNGNGSPAPIIRESI